MTDDRLTFNERGDWLGPHFALGQVDELVMRNATVHFEMSSDTSGYLIAQSATRCVILRLNARPATRRERRQVLAHSDDRLRDHLASLLPTWLGGRSLWSIPWYRRPASAVRGWRDGARSARAVLCAECDEDEARP